MRSGGESFFHQDTGDSVLLFSALDFVPISLGSLFQLVFPILVIDPVLQLIRQILLGHPMTGIIMGIQVMLSPLLGIRSVKMLVLQLPWKGAASSRLNILGSGGNGQIGGIGFGLGGQEYRRLSQRNTGLRQTDLRAASTQALTMGMAMG